MVNDNNNVCSVRGLGVELEHGHDPTHGTWSEDKYLYETTSDGF